MNGTHATGKQSTERPPAMLAPGTFHIIGPAFTSNSFPSGHTITAFAFAGALSLLRRRRPSAPLAEDELFAVAADPELAVYAVCLDRLDRALIHELQRAGHDGLLHDPLDRGAGGGVAGVADAQRGDALG